MPREKREPKKGAGVKFVAGKYAGLQGWINDGENATDCYAPVIVKMKRSKGGAELATMVKHENYVLLADLGNPKNYEEAIMIQHPDIYQLLTKLVRQLAEYEQVSGKTISKVFLDRLANAVDHQNQRGHKARWRRVIFGNGR